LSSIRYKSNNLALKKNSLIMQRVILVCFVASLVSIGGLFAQNNTQDTSPPAWLPTAKKDTTDGQAGRPKDLKSFITGLDPVVGASVPGGKGKSTTLSTLFGETIPDLGLRVKEYKSQKGERKRKKEKAKLAKYQYEGIPMQSMQVKFGSGDRATVEYFHVLKSYQPMDPYVRSTEIRWYDKKTRKLSSSLVKDKTMAFPLHGSYKKYVGENLIEEGFYYMGVKDGRWARYDTKYNLLDKTTWYRGFPAESRIAYYDSAHTKIKEVVPVVFGQVQGQFLKFYPEGQLMVEGKYAYNKKVGRWIEYYQFNRTRKKEIQYPKDNWDEDFESFVLREFDEKGKPLYDHSKDPRALVEEEDPKEITEN
jgi:antitoxin component YwqK of YwqJK toxin-antitoxin module